MTAPNNDGHLLASLFGGKEVAGGPFLRVRETGFQPVQHIGEESVSEHTPKAGLDVQTLCLCGPHFVYRVKVLASRISIVCGSITVRK
jgi:hypothetical protein